MNEHEVNYRTKKIFELMKDFKIFVCGAGALGSNLINIMSRQGFKNITVIDMDRVEEHNIATQLYTLKDVGQMKVKALQNLIHQTNKNILNIVDKQLRENNVSKLFKDHNLVVDVFDNWESRKIVQQACLNLNIPCVHAGMSDNGFSEIKWNSSYKIPDREDDQEDICDYPLASNLVHFTVAVLSESIVQFVATKKELNREITLNDIGVHKY